MSAREHFFKKLQHKNDRVPSGIKSADAEVRTFCARMDELAQQISQWFAGSGIEVTLSTRHLHDLGAVGYSLNSGICRYDITAIRLQNGDRSVRLLPEQLWNGAETGIVTLHVDAPGIRQVFYLSMAPEAGWFIRRQYQSARDNVIMTEELFFEAVDRLA
ncbi:hypothetical protein [Leclercia adecarboxylata]|uniref:hypothetical protein n=1 Tax=Leclercia adecarboxylata TaxID=83655 RepID=UPI002550F397|nr:hypothetical protein [Leclercia adecarboxylata]